jgi:hypothetical protein
MENGSRLRFERPVARAIRRGSSKPGKQEPLRTLVMRRLDRPRAGSPTRGRDSHCAVPDAQGFCPSRRRSVFRPPAPGPASAPSVYR